ncbi:MAG: endo-1,4-beta-xylanase [Bacteroidales bacterium]|nr:endo-1,4-beta-xylanase [Bacteroidales bacterium]
MKYNRFILPLLACAALSTACVDEIMEWQEPDQTITEDDLPLSDDESMSLYKSIREYAEEYTPDMKIGLGLGADKYIEDAAYRALADEQFQMFTTGNAMKHSSVVKANGDLDFTTIDAFMQLVPSDIEVYGHNFLWHTQQKQQYLKSLIAPEMKVEVPQGEKCENVVTNGGFEDGTNGYTGLWGKYTYEVVQPGRDGSGNAIHFTISPECANQWDAQIFWALDGFLEPGVTYYYEFYAKSDSGLQCQFIGQNAEYGGIYKDTFTPGTDWTFFSGEFTHGETDLADIERVGLQFGGEPGSQIWFDDFKFGKKLEEVEQEPMIDIVGDDGKFEWTDGTTGSWTGLWGKYTYQVVSPGYSGNQALEFTLTAECVNQWDAQLFYPYDLEVGKTYAYSFWAKSDSGLAVQFIGQNDEYAGIYKDSFELASDWILCSGEFTYAETDPEAICRVGVQFGRADSEGAKFYIDDFKFGEKNPEYGAPEEPADPMINIVGDAGTFEDGEVSAFGCWGNNSPVKEISADGDGYNSKYAMMLTNPEEGGEYQEWKAQCAYDLADYLSSDKIYVVSFWVRSDVPGTVQFQYQNGTTYGSQGGYHRVETSSDWFYVEYEFQTSTTAEDGTVTAYDDVNRLLINFGAFAATYYIDDFKFGEKIPSPAAARRYNAPKMQKAAPVITYIYKTPEEKKALLLGAMESWIKQMAEHLPTVKYWDVINEPIMDGSNEWRGINNVFNGEDTAPVENEGLTLNWASDHWYWGYYIGQEYAVKAFEYARQYCGQDAKLFVNDYNLEVSPGKLKALIGFADYIDKNNSTGAPLVDGIGTQMHVSTSITKEQVDEMFKTMAATGKLVRVTELDVQVGTASPTADQLLAQAETYKMIVESYKANIPAAQQSGITIWTLTDAADEHEFWLSDDAPNLFDANYGRKLAYKYFCDGLAGKDISSEFTGSEWKDLHATEEEPETENPETEETPAE